MYIHSISINNIRSIEALEMTFPEEGYAGWHVILGDNGAGKSTFVRSVAVALIGPEDAKKIIHNWESWLRKDTNLEKGTIQITFSAPIINEGVPKNATYTKIEGTIEVKKPFNPLSVAKGSNIPPRELKKVTIEAKDPSDEINAFWDNEYFNQCYSSFGISRRFTGENRWFDKRDHSDTKIENHISVFNDDIALTSVLGWLDSLNYLSIDKKVLVDKRKEAKSLLDHIVTFINNGDLLPHNLHLEKISAEGLFFVDGNGIIVLATELSHGQQSILSMTFEIIRQLISAYGAETVFEHIQKGEAFINVPGVILIDEVDAHLHPTWQTRIGQWFTRYFPQIQFIVTTHSPLICRGAEKGTIWRLPAPGSDEKVEQIMGAERDKLVFGNVLDAYSTDAFGVNIARSDKSQEMLEKLSKLNMKATFGKLNAEEKKEQAHLQKIFISDDTLKL